jgi:hypothetical protein
MDPVQPYAREGLLVLQPDFAYPRCEDDLQELRRPTLHTRCDNLLILHEIASRTICSSANSRIGLWSKLVRVVQSS